MGKLVYFDCVHLLKKRFYNKELSTLSTNVLLNLNTTYESYKRFHNKFLSCPLHYKIFNDIYKSNNYCKTYTIG